MNYNYIVNPLTKRKQEPKKMRYPVVLGRIYSINTLFKMVELVVYVEQKV